MKILLINSFKGGDTFTFLLHEKSVSTAFLYFLATALATAPEIFMACIVCQYKSTEGHGCNKEFFRVGFWNYSRS